MIIVSSCSCLRPIDRSRVLSREWRCSWSSADRRCSNYIWWSTILLPTKVRLILETWRYTVTTQAHVHQNYCNVTTTGWYYHARILRNPATPRLAMTPWWPAPEPSSAIHGSDYLFSVNGECLVWILNIHHSWKKYKSIYITAEVLYEASRITVYSSFPQKKKCKYPANTTMMKNSW